MHHGLSDLRDDHFTDILQSSMVPGILPSQLEMLSTGHTYFDAGVLILLYMQRYADKHLVHYKAVENFGKFVPQSLCKLQYNKAPILNNCSNAAYNPAVLFMLQIRPALGLVQ